MANYKHFIITVLLFISSIHVLIMTPVLFSYMKERSLKRGELKKSKMASWMK
jgi:hypothetical protein